MNVFVGIRVYLCVYSCLIVCVHFCVSGCICVCSCASCCICSSRAVPHPSTNRALRRLTSEVRRDPVHSTRYGRWRHLSGAGCVHMMGLLLKAVPWCRRATQEMAFISQAVALTLGHDPTLKCGGGVGGIASKICGVAFISQTPVCVRSWM